MDDDKKQIVMILICVICIGLAGGITYWTNRNHISSGKITLLCANPQCEKLTHCSGEEFRDLIMKTNVRYSFTSEQGPTAFPCPHCHQKSCYIAEKCNKCGAYFISKYDSKTKTYLDRCPKCGYSVSEEIKKNIGISE